MLGKLHNWATHLRKLQLLPGDWLIIALSSAVIIILFATLWQGGSAARVQIRAGNTVIGTYSLNQDKTLHVHGALGEAIIIIHQGKVRFQRSPCVGQYCVHQGWLTRAGQIAICLPNQVTIELIGDKKPYDSMNY